MLRTVTALASGLVLTLAIAACGGSGDEPTVEEPAATPAPTQAAEATPRAQPTATAATAGGEATATATPAQAATATAATAATATPQPEATETADASAETTAPPVDVVEQVRARTEAMWEVYNAHDADALAAFYEPSFWEAEEEEVRANMRPFRTFGVTIRPEETSPPTEIAPGQWEIRQTGHFPLGSVKLVFVWQEFDGVWLLIHTEAE